MALHVHVLLNFIGDFGMKVLMMSYLYQQRLQQRRIVDLSEKRHPHSSTKERQTHQCP